MGWNTMSRRHFLALSTAGAAGLALERSALGQMRGGGGGCGCGGGMGGGTVVNPPPGAAFRDPAVAPSVRTAPNLVDISLDARVATANVNGTSAQLLTYNGEFVAPTIRARKGDIVRLHFTNALAATTETNLLGHTKNITNIHVHGWHVTPMGSGDNVHIKVAAGGGSFDYQYDLKLARPGAIGLYHPHVHGTVAEQMWGGLVGTLEVADEVTALAGYETHLLVLKDLSLSGGLPTPHTSMMEYMHGKQGSLVMVNGQVNPVLAIRPGQVQRWRVLNASNARFYRLALEGHQLHVVGTDGGLLDKPYPVSEILLSPGERVDLLVQATATGPRYRLLALPYARGMAPVEQVTLMTLEYGGVRVPDVLPSVVDPLAVRPQISTRKLRRTAFHLSMMHGRGYINGMTWEQEPFMLMSMLGTWEVWDIINDSGMDHPWHQHVNDAMVIGVSGGDANYARLYTQVPGWKDTVIVPKWGSVTLLVPVMDYDGMTMFHCHIIEHEDIGMMGMWHIMM